MPSRRAQLGHIEGYDHFLTEFDKAWTECARVLVSGGRICCVVGDVCLPRKKAGRHLVMPLHSDIQVRARNASLDCLTPIVWHKIANGVTEVEGNGAGFYGKPYQPGAVVKNDIEYILFLRKGGKYRRTTPLQKALSMLTKEEMQAWWRSIWTDIRGASTRGGHPAPYPVELAERLIRMFSFAGDTVLDPFAGHGLHGVAAVNAGRNSVSNEIEPTYHEIARERLLKATAQSRDRGNGCGILTDRSGEARREPASVPQLLLHRFRELFEGKKYIHRDSTLGDSRRQMPTGGPSPCGARKAG